MLRDENANENANQNANQNANTFAKLSPPTYQFNSMKGNSQNRTARKKGC